MQVICLFIILLPVLVIIGRLSVIFVIFNILKWRSATRDIIFMFWIIANDCACLMIYLFRDCLVNKLNYGILHQLPATSGHIKSKQQTFTLKLKHIIIVFVLCQLCVITSVSLYYHNQHIYNYLVTCESISTFVSCRDEMSFNNGYGRFDFFMSNKRQIVPSRKVFEDLTIFNKTMTSWVQVPVKGHFWEN